MSAAAGSLSEHIRRGLEGALGAAFPESAPQQLAALCELIHDWGQRINLTGHRSPEAIADRLVLDAAGIASVLPECRGMVDLGSGAGFPGIPIAILRPGLELCSVEPRERRHHFQRAVVRELGLANVTLLRGRAEELEPRPADLALAQAMGPPDEVLELIRPWAREGGWLGIPATVGNARPESPGLDVRPYPTPRAERELWLVPAR